jgi:peptidoglycan/LPS O-acetylase OafA/YrhL
VVIVLIEHLGFAFWANNVGAARVANIPPLTDPVAFEGFLRPFYEMIMQNIIFGDIGVALFLLISGFVIPMSLERYSPGRFFVARIFRLYPVWLVGLAAAAVMFVIARIAYGYPFPFTFGDWWRNALLIQDWTLSPYILPLVWTLLVEIKFYILCGLMAWLVGIHRALPVLGIVGALTAYTLAVEGRFQELAASDRYLYGAIQVPAFSAKFMAFMFVGFCFYNLFRERWSPLKFLGMSVAIGAAFIVSNEHAPDLQLFQDQILMSFGIGFAVFALAFAVRDWIPYSRTWNLIADVSYPLYTLHWVIGIMLITELYKLHPVPILNVAESFVIIFALAYLAHRYVEAPLTEFGKRARIDRAALARVLPGRLAGRASAPEPAVALPSGAVGAVDAGPDERPSPGDIAAP